MLKNKSDLVTFHKSIFVYEIFSQPCIHLHVYACTPDQFFIWILKNRNIITHTLCKYIKPYKYLCKYIKPYIYFSHMKSWFWLPFIVLTGPLWLWCWDAHVEEKRAVYLNRKCLFLWPADMIFELTPTWLMRTYRERKAFEVKWQ